MQAPSAPPLKFLFVSADKFPPFRVDVSVLFGKKLVERGHVIDWLLQSEADTSQSLRTTWSGCTVYVGPTDNGETKTKRLKKHLLSVIHDFKMLSFAKKKEYNFILVKDKFISSLVAIITSKIFKTKFIFWLSYPFPEWSLYEAKKGIARYPFLYWIRGHFFMLLLYRLIGKLADHIFVQSEQMKRDITDRGIPKEKLTPIPMGVSTKAIPFFGYKNQAAMNAPKRIVYLGTLKKVRKLDFVLRVFKRVLNEAPDAVLKFIGGGDDPLDEKILKKEAIKLKIDHSVVMTGFLPQQEAWENVRQAAVCISPFYPTPILNSTSPTKLIEYMAMGKAVVCNEHPEQKIVVRESKGGICVPYEEAEFAKAILHLLRNPKKTEVMGIYGRKYVEKYRDYDRIADLLEKKLYEICKKQSKHKTA